MTATLDWSKLPPELQYLVRPAEKYGAIQFEDRIMEFLSQRMTASEREELSDLCKLMIRDFVAIEAWLDKFNITKHDEARLVYFLSHLIGLGNDGGWLDESEIVVP